MTVDKGLLMHWWHYYGKSIYTLAELEKFQNIIDEYGVDKVVDIGAISYIAGDGSPQVILSSIRTNSVKEMIEKLPNVSEMKDEEQKIFEEFKEAFIEAISKGYM